MKRTSAQLTAGGKDGGERVAVQVARDILARIRSGELHEGSRLPTEQQMARQFKVSRPSVREALSALQFAGYLESKQGYGSVVLPAQPLGATQDSLSRGGIDPVDVLESRVIVEPQAAALAAMSPMPDELKVAQSMLDGMWLAVDAANRLGAETDLALHMAVARICPNPFIRDSAILLLEVSNPPEWRDRRSRVWTDALTVQRWAIEHEATLSAIERRQPERALICARHHLLSTVASIVDNEGLPDNHRNRLQELLRRFGERPLSHDEAPTD